MLNESLYNHMHMQPTLINQLSSNLSHHTRQQAISNVVFFSSFQSYLQLWSVSNKCQLFCLHVELLEQVLNALVPYLMI